MAILPAVHSAGESPIVAGAQASGQSQRRPNLAGPCTLSGVWQVTTDIFNSVSHCQT